MTKRIRVYCGCCGMLVGTRIESDGSDYFFEAGEDYEWYCGSISCMDKMCDGVFHPNNERKVIQFPLFNYGFK